MLSKSKQAGVGVLFVGYHFKHMGVNIRAMFQDTIAVNLSDTVRGQRPKWPESWRGLGFRQFLCCLRFGTPGYPHLRIVGSVAGGVSSRTLRRQQVSRASVVALAPQLSPLRASSPGVPPPARWTCALLRPASQRRGDICHIESCGRGRGGSFSREKKARL